MIRTYLSVFLLLCLAVQFAPMSLLHSHDDHHSQTETSHHEIASHHADDMDGVNANSVHDDSSEEDCKICEIQQTLNNQSYTLVKKVNVFNGVQQVSKDLAVKSSGDNYLINSIAGRAPPRA